MSPQTQPAPRGRRQPRDVGEPPRGGSSGRKIALPGGSVKPWGRRHECFIVLKIRRLHGCSQPWRLTLAGAGGEIVCDRELLREVRRALSRMEVA
jgi:hypothetical protein